VRIVNVSTSLTTRFSAPSSLAVIEHLWITFSGEGRGEVLLGLKETSSPVKDVIRWCLCGSIFIHQNPWMKIDRYLRRCLFCQSCHGEEWSATNEGLSINRILELPTFPPAWRSDCPRTSRRRKFLGGLVFDYEVGWKWSPDFTPIAFDKVLNGLGWIQNNLAYMGNNRARMRNNSVWILCTVIVHPHATVAHDCTTLVHCYFLGGLEKFRWVESVLRGKTYSPFLP
jgi:hypothetical protein